jgi:hypothetical protein
MHNPTDYRAPIGSAGVFKKKGVGRGERERRERREGGEGGAFCLVWCLMLMFNGRWTMDNANNAQPWLALAPSSQLGEPVPMPHPGREVEVQIEASTYHISHITAPRSRSS